MFAALARLGCDREHTPNVPAEPSAIGFGNVTTRAVDSADDIDEFPVWACMADPSADYYAPILTEERVYKGSEGEWTYDNTRLWVDNSHFFFFSVFSDVEDYPRFTEYKFDPQENGSQYIVYALDYVTPETADFDILAAFNYTNTSVQGYSKTVPMQFTHLLTKFNIKVEQDFNKSPDFDYYIKKVTLSGVKSEGSYLAMPRVDGLYSGWSFGDEPTFATFEKSFVDAPVRLRNTDPNVANKKVVLTVFEEDGLLLIPQEIAANTIRLRIDYYYDVDTSDSDMGVERYVEVYLPTSPLWEPNKIITYKLAISEQTDIKFLAPTIESWGSPQTGGTIIIK